MKKLLVLASFVALISGCNKLSGELVGVVGRAAHANSEAKIPSPVKIINQPGPGATNATTPTKVIKPPMKPTKTRFTTGFIPLSYY